MAISGIRIKVNQMPQTANRSMDLATWGLLLLLGFIWGGSFFFGRIAVQHVPPMTLVLFRVSLAALALPPGRGEG